MKIFVLLSFLLTSILFANAQEIPPAFDYGKKFSPAELRQDLQTLKDSLSINHPALYRYSGKRKFDSAFAATNKILSKPLSRTEFYTIVSPLAGMAGDIHTTIDLPDEAFSHIATQAELLPFDVRIINDRVYIASNNTADPTIPVGSRILKINDQPIEKILARMKTSFSDEGLNNTLKTRRVEQRFAFQYHVLFGSSKEFILVYAPGDRNRQRQGLTLNCFRQSGQEGRRTS